MPKKGIFILGKNVCNNIDNTYWQSITSPCFAVNREMDQRSRAQHVKEILSVTAFYKNGD